MKRYTTLLAILLYLSFAAFAQTQSKVLMNAAPEAGGFSASRLIRIDEGINDWIKKKWTNGAVALIARNGKIVYNKAFGYNDLTTKEPLDKNGTVRMMTSNQIGDLTLNIGDNKDNKFGFGLSVRVEKGNRGNPRQPGTYAWGGVFSTTFWVDPKEHMLVILYEQMWGPHIAETQKLFNALVYQAITN